MKTYQIKDLLKKEVLIIELPEETYYEVFKHGILFKDHLESEREFIEGTYTLLGKSDEIKEEDVKDLVDLFSIESGRCQDYIRPECGYVTALESFNSALESEIYWDVNPIGNEPELEAICCGNSRADAWGYPQCCGVPNATEESIELHSIWYDAQSRTFDRNRSIIFVNN